MKKKQYEKQEAKKKKIKRKKELIIDDTEKPTFNYPKPKENDSIILRLWKLETKLDALTKDFVYHKHE